MEKKQSKVKVIVRVRPSLNDDAKICVSTDANSVEIFNHRNVNENIKYEFCSVFNSSSTQQEIYFQCVKDIIPNALRGENLSIFAYGPTGAGKTHTMLGSPSDPGIITRVINGLFKIIAENSDSVAQYKYSVSFSYLEIYNEKVQDLLEPSNNDLPIREDGEHNIFIAGLAEKTITSFDEFKLLFGPASNNRTVAATKLNDHSSRSHSILMLKVHKVQQCPPYREYSGKIYLIDLAGSEDNRRTGNKGIRLKESGAINKSLFSLGEVVDAINNNLPRIPYRNSKLTRLLQDSIGGSCHSIMITNIAPEEHYYYDTYCTLNFASKSKKIVNTTTVSTCIREPSICRPSTTSLKRAYSVPAVGDPKKPKLSSKSSLRSLTSLPYPPQESTDMPVLCDPAPLLSPLLRRQTNLEKTVDSILQHIRQQETKQKSAVVLSPSATADIQKQLAVCQQHLMKLYKQQESNKLNKDDSRQVLKDKTNAKPVHKPVVKKEIDDSDGITCSPLFATTSRVFKKGFKSTAVKTENDESPKNRIKELCRSFNPELQKKHNAQFLNIINTASIKELQNLHTVGNKRARLIFEWRELNGCFTELEDLKKVPGFSEKKYQTLLQSNLVMQFS
ncbi:kinesin-like protein KIF22 [Gigantopelta aegis]|uniref:kinesin-like protein KIF22 n=1 Tax=Gigantopelta aegis TaxID=1735272 RepID=UPI001B888C6F|nr:kinesin-like protein KIF22 [Gigantopelta aegis]